MLEILKHMLGRVYLMAYTRLNPLKDSFSYSGTATATNSITTLKNSGMLDGTWLVYAMVWPTGGKCYGLAMPLVRLDFWPDDGQAQSQSVGNYHNNRLLQGRDDAARDILPDKHGNWLEIQRHTSGVTPLGVVA